MSATRAAIVGMTTVVLWSMRVAARILRMLADVIADAADYADRGRGRDAATA